MPAENEVLECSGKLKEELREYESLKAGLFQLDQLIVLMIWQLSSQRLSPPATPFARR